MKAKELTKELMKSPNRDIIVQYHQAKVPPKFAKIINIKEIKRKEKDLSDLLNIKFKKYWLINCV